MRLWIPIAGIALLLPTASARPEQPKPESSAPFKLTAEEHKSVDAALDRWEQWNARVKTFRCRFKRWRYDSAFSPSNPLQSVDSGTIEYAAPQRMMFRTDSTEKDGKATPLDDQRAEKWIFDGKSIYQYDFSKKLVIEHRLPPDIQPSRLVDGPLAFGFPLSIFPGLFDVKPLTPYPFGAKAKELKQRYYFRVITPRDAKDHIWFEAYPRSGNAALGKLQLIFNQRDMSPFALRIVEPNGKDYRVYQFYDMVVNGTPAAAKDDPFRPGVPTGWQRISDVPP